MKLSFGKIWVPQSHNDAFSREGQFYNHTMKISFGKAGVQQSYNENFSMEGQF